MDENYLDQLLKTVENQNSTLDESDELKSDPQTAPDLELEENLSADASAVQSVAWSDAEIPVDEISELDELDELADLDMGQMDFEDIDFDDLDITKMDVNPVQLKQELDNLEFLDIDEKYLDDSEAKAFEEEFKRMKDAEKAEKAGTLDAIYEDQDFVNTFDDEPSPIPLEPEIDAASTDGESEDLITDIDALMEEVFGEPVGKDLASMNAKEQSVTADTESSVDDTMEQSVASDIASSHGETESVKTADDDMDDLFAMLGIEENSATMAASAMPDMNHEIPDFEIPPELEDVPDIHEKAKKKGFMDILFGEEEEDDVLTPEQEEELKKEKEEKKKAKLAKKTEKKQAKAEKKQADKEQKTAKANEKKAVRKAEEERILAEDGPEKKLNKPLVIIIMIFFLAIGGIVIVGSGIFDYSLVITKAKSYFERQKYGLAYREIVGVQIKEKDEELEDRIYTVMYVERQYEAYQNYVLMDNPNLALDALLCGLEKYDAYYGDAVALDIVEDLDYVRDEIIDALNTTYGLSEEDARDILSLTDSEYTEKIQELTEGMSFRVE